MRRPYGSVSWCGDAEDTYATNRRISPTQETSTPTESTTVGPLTKASIQISTVAQVGHDVAYIFLTRKKMIGCHLEFSCNQPQLWKCYSRCMLSDFGLLCTKQLWTISCKILIIFRPSCSMMRMRRMFSIWSLLLVKVEIDLEDYPAWILLRKPRNNLDFFLFYVMFVYS